MSRSTNRDVIVSDESFDLVPRDDAAVIRANSRSFSFASLLLPAVVRADVEKLYAWCRWCDDAVDSAESKAEATRRLVVLRADVERIYQGQIPVHRASRWLAGLVAKYRIDKKLPLALLDAMEMDLRLGQIQSEDELTGYCFHAAGVVGLMMCKVFGVTDPRAAKHAEALGIAMQLTNIARDVREDWQRGRCYLPYDWTRFDWTVSLPTNEQVRPAVQRILEMADEHYEVGIAGIQYLPASVRPAIRTATAVYREIGRQIYRNQLRVIDGRTIVPRLRFALAATVASLGGLIDDTRQTLGLVQENIANFPSTTPEFIMNDAKYLIYLGLSLTAFMGSGLFLLVMLNPKDASYSFLPMVYALVCFAVGIVTNLLAKKAEKPVPVAVNVTANVTEEASSMASHR